MTVTAERLDCVMVRGLDPADTLSGSPNVMFVGGPRAHRSWCDAGEFTCDDAGYCDSRPTVIELDGGVAKVAASLLDRAPSVWVWLPGDNDGFLEPRTALAAGMELVTAAHGGEAHVLVSLPDLDDHKVTAGQALAIGTALVNMAFLAGQE